VAELNTHEINTIEDGKHHVSKSYIATSVFRGLWAVVIGIIVVGGQALGNAENILELSGRVRLLPLFIAIGLILILGAVFLFAILSYKRLTWEITDEELHIYKGIFIKKKSHIPFRRIHSVDINAKLLDRIFGVVTLKLDTAAGSAKSEDAKLPALHLSTAELIRKEIFHRKAVSESGVSYSDTVKQGGGNILNELNTENEKTRGLYAGTSQELVPQAEYRLTNKELMIYCLTNGKAFVFVFLALIFVQELFDMITTFNREFAETANSTVTTLISKGPLVILIIIAVALVVGLIISFISRALTYGNFVAKRYVGRIEISSGLVQRKSTGIAVERIQTLKIKQGLLARILGYAEISVETASGFGKSGQKDQEIRLGTVIHPFIKKSKINEFMDMMLIEFNDRPEEATSLSGVAMRRSMFRYGIWTLLLIVLPLQLTWYFVRTFVLHESEFASYIPLVNNTVIASSVVILAIMLLIGFGAWKGRAIGRNDNYLLLKKGVIGRNSAFVPKKKIQYAMVGQNLFQKRVSLVTIRANTAANGESNESLKDVGEHFANEYLDWIEHKI
jgi:uncharacterized membrane protein YdbT with pleckstrin-like domain